VTALERAPLTAARAVAVACLLALAAYVPVLLRPPSSTVAVFWPAAGVALVALVLTPRRHWPHVAALVLLGTGAGNLAAGRDVLPALLLGAANTVEALVTAAVFLRLGAGRYRLVHVRDGWHLLLASAAGALVGGAVAGVTAEATLGGELWTAWRSFAASHPAGVALAAPLALLGTPTGRRLVPAEVVVQPLLLGLAVAAAFWPGQGLPLTFLPLPVLVWAAARFGTRAATLQVLAVAGVATVCTLSGRGPFAAVADQVASTSALQVYLLSLGVAVVVLGLTVEDDRRKAVVLAAGEELYRRTFDEAMLGMLMLRVGTAPGSPAGARVVRCNPVAAALLDRDDDAAAGTPDGPVGGRFEDHLHPDSAPVLTSALDRVVGGELATWHGEVRLAGPRDRRVAVTLSPLRDEAGRTEQVTVQLSDVTARHRAEARLIEQALHDALTGLPNRTLLRDRLGEGLADGQGGPARLALLFCDLDDFKLVNDSAGHRVGDALLVEVASRLGGLRPDDTVARLGGDEFVVLSPVTADDAHAHADELAALVLEMLTAPVDVQGVRYRLSASIGITLSRAGSTPESLLREADSAMYQAKREGKNRAAWFTEEHHLQARRQVRLVQELHAALERQEFRLHVQPVVDLRTGRVVAGEALVRWQHPDRGLLAPGEWLDVAEGSDVIHALGTWVIDEACRMASCWVRALGDLAPVVHANVSARQLGQGTLVPDVEGSLQRHDLRGDRLVLELTETQLDHAHSAVLGEVVQVRAAGVGLAADDFGTGYSSLTRLTEMPVDMIKVDRAFVSRMLEDDRARAVVSCLVTMGTALGVDVVAEGVETLEQAECLAAMGCHLAQGFWWSRPVPEAEFLALVGHPLPSVQVVA
jgi:diguanylate cyclase (GGDEF)-like protein